MTIQLTPAQHAILAYALEHTDGRIEWFPANIKGGARNKVLEGLQKRALVTNDGDEWFVSDTGHQAMKPGHAQAAPLPADPEVEAEVAAAEAAWEQDKQAAAQRLIQVGVEGKPRTRENSKQALVLALLGRPEGATIAQIMEATGWQAHTVRGTFAGAFKKKLGLDLVSEKSQAGRVYRISQAA